MKEELASYSATASRKRGVALINTAGPEEGTQVALGLLYRICRDDTVLFLSGGGTPETLYSQLASQGKLALGAAGMVDERYGRPGHEKSNELMIERSLLIDYLTMRHIPFASVLADNRDLESTASLYDGCVRDLLRRFSTSVAVLGIGGDGHVAGVLPNRPGYANPLFSPDKRDSLVSFSTESPEGRSSNPGTSEWLGPRVTMTLQCLALLSMLVVMAFGDRKRSALSSLFRDGQVEDLPARFLTSSTAAPKTVLITDQRI
jgi:6-phosphogluconolactonase/glucosamine-6-phosphate isomerase/deaminase